MARKTSAELAAAKAKKQKIVLIVGGVLLLAVGAIQVPKLLGGSTEAAAVPVADVGAAQPGVAPTVTTPAGGSATTVTGSGPRATAVLAGVTIQGAGTPAPAAGQLITFSLFEAKDPFVPQASDEISGTTQPTVTPTLSDTQPETVASSDVAASGGATGGVGAPAPAAPPATTNATIVMNGKAYYLGLKDDFPKVDPLFVLVSLKPKVARIGVAGGSFADTKTIPLSKGKKVTLVNDATGARYVLKLVYTGSTPEKTESFTQAGK